MVKKLLRFGECKSIPRFQLKDVRPFGQNNELEMVIENVDRRLVPVEDIKNIRSFGADVQAAGVVITEGRQFDKAKE